MEIPSVDIIGIRTETSQRINVVHCNRGIIYLSIPI